MSHFKPWIDTASDTTLPSYEAFVDTTTSNDRQLGFRSGTVASSKFVNAGLRQANLVTTAIMDLADTNGATNFRSSVEAVKDKIETYLKNGSYFRVATSVAATAYPICVEYSKVADKDTDGNSIAAKFSSINTSITTINTNIATINSRLTDLGFKSGSISRAGGKSLVDPSNSKVYKQGKVIVVHLAVNYSSDEGQVYSNVTVGNISITGETNILTQNIQFEEIYSKLISGNNYYSMKYTYTITTSGEIKVTKTSVSYPVVTGSQKTHTIVSNFKNGVNTIYYS